MNERPWYERLGGANAVTWPIFWVTLLATFTAYVVGNPDIFTQDIPANIAILIFANAINFGIVWVLQPLTRLVRRPIAATLVMLAIFIAAGAVRGIVIAYTHVAFGFVAEPDLAFRMYSSVLVIVTALVVTALWHDAIQRHRRALSDLADLREQLRATRDDAARIIDSRQRNTITSIRSRVQREIDALNPAFIGIGVEHLRYLAHEIVRPLSHELATQAQRITPRELVPTQRALDWQRLLRDTLAVPPLRPFALAVMPAYVSLPISTHLVGVSRGMLVSASVLGMVWFLATVLNPWLHAAMQRLTTPWRVIGFTVLITLMGGVAMIPAWFLFGPDAARWIIIPGTWYFAPTAWVLAGTAAARRQYADTEAALSQARAELDWEVARANELQWQRQRTLSLTLHGPLQAALNAAALRLDAARQRDEVTDALISDIAFSVEAALDELEADTDQPTDVRLAFERIAGTWAGLCDVRFDIAAAIEARLTADPVAARAVADIVIEACSNAVRHGGATEIAVLLDAAAEGLLRIDIRDNGIEMVEGELSTGLGSQLLDQCTVRWQRGREGDWSTLAAWLPLASAAAVDALEAPGH